MANESDSPAPPTPSYDPFNLQSLTLTPTSENVSSPVQHVTTQASHHFIGPENTDRVFIGPETRPTTTPSPSYGPTPRPGYSHSYPGSAHSAGEDRLGGGGVRGPHLPLTAHLEIRHDGEPTPVKQQTHVQVSQLPFFHSTAFTREKQYHVIDRQHPPPTQRPNNRRTKEFSVNLENGHSYFKIGSPSENKIKVDFTQRELNKNFAPVKKEKEREMKKVSIFNLVKKDENIADADYEDYDHLIKQGTMTEFLKL